MRNRNILNDAQLGAIEKMKNGCILNGGVGSGKSRTALAYYFIQNDGVVQHDILKGMKKHPLDLYVITTARKRDDNEWASEMCLFLISSHPEATPYKHKVVIDSWNNIKKYREVKNAFFIFDEQRVVGSGTWVKSFLRIAKSNQWILLSATPGDTWSDYMPVFIANGYFKNMTEFRNNHVIYDHHVNFPRIKGYFNEGRLIRLRNNILVDIPVERHTVSHHIDIPVQYDFDAYNELMKYRWNPEKDKPVENASELCYLLRKIVNADESRQVAILELLEKNDKVIIFYNFDYELEILRTLCKDHGYSVGEWNGHVHEMIPEGDKWVYLVQYTAGCEGWNCIKTDTLIFYSQNYSYKIMEQARGRIDRMNTPYEDLYYYHLKSKAPIDRAIGKAIGNKKKFNESAYLSKRYHLSFQKH